MTGAVSIRPTSRADLSEVTALLSERDQHGLNPADVASALCNLEPAHLAGWIAFVGERPAGLTTLYTREHRWGEDRMIRAGYWSHLYVPEEFRRLMIYPQLVLAMMRGIKPLGIDCIFTGTRRPHVAEGHVKLGFAKLGEYRVLYKPLRPFRLLARYKDLPLQAASAPGDALYGAFQGLRRPQPAQGLTLRDGSEADADSLCVLLNAAGEGRISQVWAPASLRRRLARTIDGYDYRTLIAARSGRTVGAAVYRLTVRERVSAGIIMELVAAPDEPLAAASLLGEVERRLRAEGADTTLYLNGLEPATNSLLSAAGHRTSNETYQMLVWPKTLVPAAAPAADLANWRFSFLDHDAF